VVTKAVAEGLAERKVDKENAAEEKESDVSKSEAEELVNSSVKVSEELLSEEGGKRPRKKKK
jgi:hypothetical protein